MRCGVPVTLLERPPSAYQSRCCGEGVSRVPTCKILSRGHLRKCLQTQRYTVKFMLTVIREPCSSLQNIVQPTTTWQAPQLRSKVGWRKELPPATQRGTSAISANFTCKILSPLCMGSTKGDPVLGELMKGHPRLK